MMTWVEVRCVTNWVIQAPHMAELLKRNGKKQSGENTKLSKTTQTSWTKSEINLVFIKQALSLPYLNWSPNLKNNKISKIKKIKLKATIHSFKLEDCFMPETNNSRLKQLISKRKHKINGRSLSLSPFVSLIC